MVNSNAPQETEDIDSKMMSLVQQSPLILEKMLFEIKWASWEVSRLQRPLSSVSTLIIAFVLTIIGCCRWSDRVRLYDWFLIKTLDEDARGKMHGVPSICTTLTYLPWYLRLRALFEIKRIDVQLVSQLQSSSIELRRAHNRWRTIGHEPRLKLPGEWTESHCWPRYIAPAADR